MKNLKAIRTSKGISQAELSRMTGIGRERLSDCENGRAGATIKTALRIAKALNVSLDELVDGEITIQEPKTNIERFKAYNIKEMAEFLNDRAFCPHRICIQRTSNFQGSCKACIMKWLQSEIK